MPHQGLHGALILRSPCLHWSSDGKPRVVKEESERIAVVKNGSQVRKGPHNTAPFARVKRMEELT